MSRAPSLTEPGPLAKNLDDLAALVYALRTHVQIHTERLNTGAATFNELRQEVGLLRPKTRQVNWLGIAAFAISVLGLAFAAGTYPNRAELVDAYDRLDARASKVHEDLRAMERDQVRTRILIDAQEKTIAELRTLVQLVIERRTKKGADR